MWEKYFFKFSDENDENCGARGVVKVSKNHTIEIIHTGTVCNVFQAIGVLKRLLSLKPLEWKRVYPFELNNTKGRSGRIDLSLFSGHKKVCHLHVSCAGKINQDIKGFLPDLITLFSYYFKLKNEKMSCTEPTEFFKITSTEHSASEFDFKQIVNELNGVIEQEVVQYTQAELFDIGKKIGFCSDGTSTFLDELFKETAEIFEDYKKFKKSVTLEEILKSNAYEGLNDGQKEKINIYFFDNASAK